MQGIGQQQGDDETAAHCAPDEADEAFLETGGHASGSPMLTTLSNTSKQLNRL